MPHLIFYLVSLFFLPLRIVGQRQQCAASGTYKDCCPGANNQFVIFQGKEYKVLCDQGIVYSNAVVATQDPKACVVLCNADPKCMNAYWSPRKACVMFKWSPQAGNVALVSDVWSEAVASAISSERSACSTKVAAAVTTAVSQCQSTERAACATRVSNAISTERAACASRISSAVSTERASCTSKISSAIASERAACTTKVSMAVASAVSTERAACASRISSAVSTERASCASRISSAVSRAVSTERAACTTKVSRAVASAVSTAKKACQTKVAGAVRKCQRDEKIKCDRRVQSAACNKCKTKPPVTKPKQPVTKPRAGYDQASISQICGQPSTQYAGGRPFVVWARCQGSGPHLNGFDGQKMNSNQECMAACARDPRCRMAHKFDSSPGPKYRNACFTISQITLVSRDPKATLMLRIG